MALDPNGPAPCSLLNTTGYPTLFVIPSTDENLAYQRIASGGTPVKYVDSLNGNTDAMTNTLLGRPNSTSTSRLIQFLSGGGVAGMASVSSSTLSPGASSVPPSGSASATQTYTTLGAVALKNQSGTYEGIIDTYIAPMVPNYLTPPFTTTSSLLSDDKFWAPSDLANGTPVNAPASVLGKLIKAGYLLSESQVYTPSQLVAGSTNPTAGTESLIYLYNLSQKTTLSSAQQMLQAKLEATNLKFFGAFMAEYCFYRVRYEWLLSKFFSVYGTPTTGAGSYQTSQPNTKGTLFPTTNGDNVAQQDYISALTYQMACLNMRLSDMRTLLSKINIYYNGVFTNIQTNINSTTAVGSNAKLAQTITALQTSATKANTYLRETDFAQEAMNYNSEKNRYSNILLGLYAFLNIAALATVFQLARS